MTTQTSAAPAPGPGRLARFLGVNTTLRFRVFGYEVDKTHLDAAVWTAWLAFALLPLPMATPVRFACAGYFVAGYAMHPAQLLPVTVRALPLFILPTLMLISALWAPSPADAERKALLFYLTAFVPIFLAARLSPRKLITGFVIVESIGAMMSFLHPAYSWGHVMVGVFGQKNWLAINMFLLYVSGLTFAMDKEAPKLLRLYAVAFILPAVVLIVMSKSATTLVMLPAAALVLMGHTYIWQPAKRVPHLRTLMGFILVTLACVAMLIVVGYMNVDLKDALLEALGKDSTLTGRTMLWDHAHYLMQEHPFGFGANGYWRPERGDAITLLKAFHFHEFTRFFFHNSYLDNGVELGYPGYYATYFVAGWALLMTVITWFRNQTQANAFFLLIAALVVIRVNSEVDLATELHPMAIIFFIGALRSDRKRKPDPLVEASPPDVAPGTPAIAVRR